MAAAMATEDEGWLVDNEKSAGSTQPGLPSGATTNHSFFGLTSISEDGNFDTRTGESFSRALLLLKHEHERELCAVRARCDLELQALRQELALKNSVGIANDVPVFGVVGPDRKLHKPMMTWSSSSVCQSPPASEAPSFAPDANVAVNRAESPSESGGRTPSDLIVKCQVENESSSVNRRLLQIEEMTPRQPVADIDTEIGGALWDLLVAQGCKGSSGKLNDPCSYQVEPAPTPGGIWKPVRCIVCGAYFDCACCFAILLNCVIMGIGADVAARDRDPDAIPEWCLIASRIFSVWFVIELSLRFLADCGKFKNSKEFPWNMLDLVLVMIDIAEIMVEATAGRGKMVDVSVIRVLRVLRIVKTARVLRLVHFCRELRLMLQCMLKSLAPLFWVLVLLTLFIFVFSLFLVQITTGHLADTEGEALPVKRAVHREKLIEMFGSMTDTLYTLFQAVTGGISWGLVNAPLIDIHWINGVIFSCYIFLFVFAASNIVTGIFLEQALRSAQIDQDEVIQSQIEGSSSAYSLVKKRFMEADASGTGNLNMLQLKKLLEDKQVMTNLQRMGLEKHEAWGLSHLLNHDMRGTISIDEFIASCLRLKGNIRSIDFAIVMHENKRSTTLLRKLLDSQVAKLEELRRDLRSVMLSSSSLLAADMLPVAEEIVSNDAGGFTPREGRSAAALHSPQTPQTPGNSEGGSLTGGSPRSDTPPNFGLAPGLDLLSVPKGERPWAGSSELVACGVPPAERRHGD